jgi:hypothetical protein
MATAPPPSPGPRQHFLVEIWLENREAFKAIVLDALLFLFSFVGLAGVFLFLRWLERQGYRHDRVEQFDTVHFWGTLIACVTFVVDFVGRLIWLLLLKPKK